MIGSSELLVVLVLALFLFGPKKLPELMRSMGKAVGEYQKALRDFERETQTMVRGPEIPPRPLTEGKDGPTAEITEIARNLGIETEGKSKEDILKEIADRTKKKEKVAKPAAAK